MSKFSIYSIISHRKNSATLRYFLNYDEPEELAKGLLILFYPFRDEIEDIHSSDVLELVDKNKLLIEINILLTGLIEEIEKINQKRDNDEEEHEQQNNFQEETTSQFDTDDIILSATKAAQRNV